MLIIIILMLVIGIINIGSVLLVMIVVRSNFIGILKALGANNWALNIPLPNRLIDSKGNDYRKCNWFITMFLQAEFQILKLDATVYYLSNVPIELSILNILMVYDYVCLMHAELINTKYGHLEDFSIKICKFN